MDALRVTATGLADFAALCERAAASAVAVPPPLAQSNFRSSAEAVRNMHAIVAVASQRVSKRLTHTGETAAAASAAYDTQDGNSAVRIDTLTFGA